MTDPLENTDDAATVTDATSAAAALKHEPQPDAAELPDDVHDGEAGPGEDDPAIADQPPTTTEAQP